MSKKFHTIYLTYHVLELDNREAFKVSLIENIHRHTLDPIVEVHAFKKYVTDFDWEGIS
jgi:ParB-like chromosome segregation protein Spo0J